MKPVFRLAEEADIGLILQFIRALAEYEKMLDQVVADEAILKEQLFEKKQAEVIFAFHALVRSKLESKASLHASKGSSPAASMEIFPVKPVSQSFSTVRVTK